MSANNEGVPHLRLPWAEPVPRREWEQYARCAEDPDLWFSDVASVQKQAQALCLEDCPVLAECRELLEDIGLSSKNLIGVWAGTRYVERRRAR